MPRKKINTPKLKIEHAEPFKWISVKEFLPEFDLAKSNPKRRHFITDELLTYNGTRVRAMYRVGEGEREFWATFHTTIFGTGEVEEQASVTHWMPFPEPPSKPAKVRRASNAGRKD